MKKYLFITSLIILSNSCDVVEGPYITDSDSYVNPEKNVLIEDFTGHLCSNCPQAAREISAIHDVYGDQIIALAIHTSTSFARPYLASQTGFQYDFRTTWGEAWDNKFGASAIGLPRGMVHRIGGQSTTLRKDEWAEVGADELSTLIEDVSVVEKRLGDSGRVLLRPSGTEPVLRVMVEATDKNIATKEAQYLVEKVKQKLV